MQARAFLTIDLAEAHDNAEFVRVDTECEGQERNECNRNGRDQEQERTGNSRTARHDLLQAIPTALEQLFKIGLLSRAAARGPLPPRSALAATAAALITPRHLYFASPSPVHMPSALPGRAPR